MKNELIYTWPASQNNNTQNGFKIRNAPMPPTNGFNHVNGNHWYRSNRERPGPGQVRNQRLRGPVPTLDLVSSIVPIYDNSGNAFCDWADYKIIVIQPMIRDTSVQLYVNAYYTVAFSL